MKIRIAVMAVLCIFVGLTGCGGTATTRLNEATEFRVERLAGVTIGMPMEKVVSILGLPSSFGQDEKGRAYYRYFSMVSKTDYVQADMIVYRTSSRATYNEGLHVSIFYENGRVAAIIKEVYPGKQP